MVRGHLGDGLADLVQQRPRQDHAAAGGVHAADLGEERGAGGWGWAAGETEGVVRAGGVRGGEGGWEGGAVVCCPLL